MKKDRYYSKDRRDYPTLILEIDDELDLPNEIGLPEDELDIPEEIDVSDELGLPAEL